MLLPLQRPARAAAALVHLAASAAVVASVAALMFGVWYPGPFRHLAGGVTLFVIIASVDVVLGPLMTLVVFDPTKSRRALAIDLGVILSLQLGALAYGVWTMAAARPAVVAFEIDLFRVVTAIEVAEDQAPPASVPLKAPPWTGPALVAADRPAPEEMVEATMLGMSGIHLAMQPRYWRDFDSQRQQAWQAARPIDALPAHLRGRLPAELMPWPARTHPPLAELRWLPLMSSRARWTVFIDRSGSPVAFAPFDAP